MPALETRKEWMAEVLKEWLANKNRDLRKHEWGGWSGSGSRKKVTSTRAIEENRS